MHAIQTQLWTQPRLQERTFFDREEVEEEHSVGLRELLCLHVKFRLLLVSLL